MDDNNNEKKEGISMKEMEAFAGKYLNEMFLVATVFCASISSYFGWTMDSFYSLISCALGFGGAIIFFNHIDSWILKAQTFLTKQDKMILLVIGCFRIILGIFVPFIVFAIVGVMAGTCYRKNKTQLQ